MNFEHVHKSYPGFPPLPPGFNHYIKQGRKSTTPELIPTDFKILPKHGMVVLRTQVKVSLVLCQVCLFFLATFEPIHDHPAEKMSK